MRFCAALIVVSALASSGIVQAECTPTQKTQIENVRNSWRTSWNAKQLDKVVELYETDAVFLPPDGSRNTGKAEIKTALQKQLGSTVAINSVSVDCSGEFAYDSGSYTQDFPAGSSMTLTGVGGSGGKKHVEGQYLVVLKHEKGSGVGIGSNLGIGSNEGIGGGSDIWRIVQHAATAKP